MISSKLAVLTDSTSRYCNSPNTGPNKFSPTRVSTLTSALAKHIQPIQLSGAPKTGSARVLTSSECMKMLEEKERNKQLKEMEKENKKKIREEKKKQREQEQLKKKEEREKKKAEREKKKEEQIAAKEKKKAELDRKRKQCQRISCQPKRTCQSSSSGEHLSISDEGGQASKSIGETDSCAFCFELFTNDGSEWVECVCKRWVHEHCIEDIYMDEAGKEKFCPFCINKMF